VEEVEEGPLVVVVELEVLDNLQEQLQAVIQFLH
jgi:hypothetical protein